ncbi:hypothetical protein D3C87_1899820 [compost metagenome]
MVTPNPFITYFLNNPGKPYRAYSNRNSSAETPEKSCILVNHSYGIADSSSKATFSPCVAVYKHIVTQHRPK